MEHLQWCIDQTLEDLERSRRRNRPITWPNLRRLFERRWEGVVREWPEEEVRGDCIAARLRATFVLTKRFRSSVDADRPHR